MGRSGSTPSLLGGEGTEGYIEEGRGGMGGLANHIHTHTDTQLSLLGILIQEDVGLGGGGGGEGASEYERMENVGICDEDGAGNEMRGDKEGGERGMKHILPHPLQYVARQLPVDKDAQLPKMRKKQIKQQARHELDAIQVSFSLFFSLSLYRARSLSSPLVQSLSFARSLSHHAREKERKREKGVLHGSITQYRHNINTRSTQAGVKHSMLK
jgi:hypothetical protein